MRKAASEFSSKLSAAFSYIVEPGQLIFQLPWEQIENHLDSVITIYFTQRAKLSWKLQLLFCFVCVHTPTQTWWINLFLSAQIWAYHPLVTELPWNKNRIQGKTNITVDIKESFEMQACIPQTASRGYFFSSVNYIYKFSFFIWAFMTYWSLPS